MNDALIVAATPRLPRFLALREGGSPAAAAVAEKYRGLCGIRTENLMSILRFSRPEDLARRVADENGTMDEVVLMYPRPGTTCVWYKEHQANSSAPEVLWASWRWAVGINPNLHDPRKLKDLEQAAKSIRHTFGNGNFIDAYRHNRTPWGSHCLEVIKSIKTGETLADTHFRSIFVSPEFAGGWNHAAMAD